MEMERINDDVIKVLISVEDLQAHDIDILDLIDNQEEVHRLVELMVDEGNLDRQFFESGALTFQFIPSAHGDLEIFISRSSEHFQIEDFLEKEIMNRLVSKRSQNQDRKSEVAAFFDNQSESKQATDDASEVLPAWLATSTVVLTFEALEDLLGFCRELKDTPVTSDLYELDGRYILISHNLSEDLSENEAIYFVLRGLEYGQWSRTQPVAVQEHAQLLRQGDALNYFGTHL